MRLRLGVAALLLAVCLLTGCSNIKQSNRITFVTAIGVDKDGDGVAVHALVAIPGQYSELSPGGTTSTVGAPNYIISQDGKDVADAMYKMKLKTARDIEFGHTKIILFSDEIAKAGVNQSLDLFMRREEFQPIAWLGCTEGSTKPILDTSPMVPETVSDVLTDVFAQSGSDTFDILPIFLYRFYSLSVEPGKNAYMPVVARTTDGNKLQITSLALFVKDKMIGKIDPEETKILQILQQQKLQSASFTVEGGTMVLLHYRTELKADKRKMNIRIHMEMAVDQSLLSNIATANQLHELEDEVDRQTKSEVEELIRKLQRLKTDPAGLGNVYRISANGGFLDMDEWLNDIFPRMQFQVSVDTMILHKGPIH